MYRLLISLILKGKRLSPVAPASLVIAPNMSPSVSSVLEGIAPRMPLMVRVQSGVYSIFTGVSPLSTIHLIGRWVYERRPCQYHSCPVLFISNVSTIGIGKSLHSGLLNNAFFLHKNSKIVGSGSPLSRISSNSLSIS